LQIAMTDGANGIPMDPGFGIPDCDTTAVTLHMLARGGYAVDPKLIQRFEHPKKHSFLTMDFERNASVGTNIHALEALAVMPDYPERPRVWEAVIEALVETQLYQSFWIDKWHISPYYATSHIILALLRLEEYELVDYSHAVEWMLHAQHEDGSWGYFGQGTLEETAYALLTLMHYHERKGNVDLEKIRKGAVYLRRGFANDPVFPEMWIAKTLYTPVNMVKAIIIAALMLYEHLFGHSPE